MSYNKHFWLLHLVDRATRYSASCPIRTKRKQVIIEKIFIMWISIFGTAKKFMVDNGGEFDNEDYRSLCENLNIRICTTPAYSPWSNGLVERHNAILGNMITKIMNNEDVSLEIATAWAVSAKNTLYGHNVTCLIYLYLERILIFHQF